MRSAASTASSGGKASSISRTTGIGAGGGDLTLAEELNIVFACFKVTAPERAQLHHTAASRTILALEEHEVRRTPRAINLKMVAGRNGVPGHVLKGCSNQLAGIFTMIILPGPILFINPWECRNLH